MIDKSVSISDRAPSVALISTRAILFLCARNVEDKKIRDEVHPWSTLKSESPNCDIEESLALY